MRRARTARAMSRSSNASFPEGSGGSGQLAVAGLVESERERSADRPRVLELRALARFTGALENASPDRKLSAFPLLERRCDVTARRLERLAQRPGIRRRLGGPRRSVWP